MSAWRAGRKADSLITGSSVLAGAPAAPAPSVSYPGQQMPCPDEFRSQNAQTERDDHDGGTRQNQHGNADEQDGSADQRDKESLEPAERGRHVTLPPAGAWWDRGGTVPARECPRRQGQTRRSGCCAG